MTIVSLVFLQACDDSNDNSSSDDITPVTITVVDAAINNGNFTTLVAALQATGLDAVLADETANFTVFAPTDAAFALLGQETINALLADPDTLRDILTYHVIASRVNSAAAIASAGQTVEMVNGDDIGLSLDGNNLLVNSATVTARDIVTDNGIIHVIDAVLLPPADMGMPTANIVETAVAAGSFSTLVSLLQATGLDATLADPDASFTVFAPTDAAFAAIDAATLETLAENPQVLSNILLQHVVPASVNSVAAYTLNGMSATTASTAAIPIAINKDTDMLTFGGANIVTKDIYTTNGVIHVIDMVVVADVAIPAPEDTIVDVAIANGSFNTLAAALSATGLDAVLDNAEGEFTVFAPTDAAFSLLGQETIDALLADPDTLSDILLYHVISGATVLADGAVSVAQSDDKMVMMANDKKTSLSYVDANLFINKSAVSSPNVMADNGVIHVIDQVILPPTDKGEPTDSIVDVVVNNDDFSTLETALAAAGLVAALQEEGKIFTVFAPTNAAFDKIPDTVLTDLLGNTTALTNVLLQHVIADAEINSLAAFAANGASVNTMADDDVTVDIVNFTMFQDSAEHEVTYNAMYEMLVGGMNSAMAGKTLYVFDDDLGAAGSVCNDTCATNWPPLLVTDGMVSGLPGLSVITRDDATMQAAYKGRPLYFYVGDEAPGDMNGQGLGDAWWVVKQEQVALQIQGSNVTTADIYTTNGVIHVIDSVITETLE